MLILIECQLPQITRKHSLKVENFISFMPQSFLKSKANSSTRCLHFGLSLKTIGSSFLTFDVFPRWIRRWRAILVFEYFARHVKQKV